MKVYLDDDSSSTLLVRLLRREGHDVITPADIAMAGSSDAEHFKKAIELDRVLITHNHDDFFQLDELIRTAGGHHPGLLVARRDNDKTKDMKPGDIARAVRNLIAAGVPLADELHILNHWR